MYLLDKCFTYGENDNRRQQGGHLQEGTNF